MGLALTSDHWEKDCVNIALTQIARVLVIVRKRNCAGYVIMIIMRPWDADQIMRGIHPELMLAGNDNHQGRVTQTRL